MTTAQEAISAIRKEIESKKKSLEDAPYAGPIQAEIHRVYRELLSFLDTLSEEPDKDLEAEIQDKRKKLIEVFGPMNGEQVIAIKDFARHFAEWQKEQMLKEAVEGEIQMRYSGCLCAKTIRAINEDKFKLGDKVRIVVLKEEESK